MALAAGGRSTDLLSSGGTLATAGPGLASILGTGSSAGGGGGGSARATSGGRGDMMMTSMTTIGAVDRPLPAGTDPSLADSNSVINAGLSQSAEQQQQQQQQQQGFPEDNTPPVQQMLAEGDAPRRLQPPMHSSGASLPKAYSTGEQMLLEGSLIQV